MPATPQLTGLIRDLRKSTSRIDQLKILTRAWKTVQGLSPGERVEVAKHIGMREGLSLLERFGRPGGVSPAALAEAVVKAEQASPGQLNQILRDLRGSSTRARGIREGVAMLDTVLQEESDPAGKPLPSAAVDSPKSPPAPPNKVVPLTVSGRDEEPGPERVQSETPRRKAEPVPPAEPVGTPTPLDVDSPSAVALAPPSNRPAEAGPGQPVPLSASHPETTSGIQPFRFEETERSPESSPVALGPKVSSASLMKTFRKLERLIDTEPDLVSRLDTILSELPPGWPRRRGLASLIRSGALSDTDTVLSAIASLGGPFDEFWCLSAWLHGAEPSREELERALRQTRGAAGKRLLKRRLASLSMD